MAARSRRNVGAADYGGIDLKGDQLQEFLSLVEDVDSYEKRGGVMHFRGGSTGLTVCNGSTGLSVRKWARVNCIACFRQRKAVRKMIDKR